MFFFLLFVLLTQLALEHQTVTPKSLESQKHSKLTSHEMNTWLYGILMSFLNSLQNQTLRWCHPHFIINFTFHSAPPGSRVAQSQHLSNLPPISHSYVRCCPWLKKEIPVYHSLLTLEDHQKLSSSLVMNCNSDTVICNIPKHTPLFPYNCDV